MSDQRSAPEAGSGTASPPIGTLRPRLDGPRSPARRTNFDWLSSPPRRASTPFQREFLDIDWTQSPLGPICQWTPWLKQMVMMVMADPSPALIYFDNEYGEPHAIAYNEALCPLIGDKVGTLNFSESGIASTMADVRLFSIPLCKAMILAAFHHRCLPI